MAVGVGSPIKGGHALRKKNDGETMFDQALANERCGGENNDSVEGGRGGGGRTERYRENEIERDERDKMDKIDE
jgi:hypothetical protein